MTEPAETPEWRKLVDRAKHLIDLNRPEEARQYAARAAAMAPGEAAPMCVLAIATSHAGQLEAALEHASRAVGLAPELDWPHRVRGYILDELGRYDEAVAAGQEAVRLAPAEAPGYNLLAGSLRLAGRLEEAETAAARLRELAPESYEAYEVSAEVAYDRERWAEAERWAREGLRLEPGSGRLRIVLGWILTVRAQFDEAIDHVHEGVRNAPLDAWHRESLEKVTVQHSEPAFQPPVAHRDLSARVAVLGLAGPREVAGRRERPRLVHGIGGPGLASLEPRIHPRAAPPAPEVAAAAPAGAASARPPVALWRERPAALTGNEGLRARCRSAACPVRRSSPTDPTAPLRRG